MFRKKYSGVVLSKRTIQDENNKWVRFVGIGLPPIGPLNSNTARNTADVIVTVDKAMNHPDWPQARRYLSSGKGGIREFRKLLSVPIMSEARLLAVVLAMETDSTIIDVCNRVGVETARHDDEILIRRGLVAMVKAGALPGVVIYDENGDTISPPMYMGPPAPPEFGRLAWKKPNRSPHKWGMSSAPNRRRPRRSCTPLTMSMSVDGKRSHLHGK